MKRISLKNLAEQSSYSRSTLFRVLRNAPGVRASTREEVVRLLNLHGYVVEHHSGAEKIVIDTPVQNLYPEELAERIGERLKLEQYQVTLTRSWKQKAHFLREIADADAVIFSATSPLELLRRAKDTNPEIYRISLFSRCPEESELTIGVDNFGGAILTANYLAVHFGSIGVFCNPNQEDSAERGLLVHSCIQAKFPQVRCELINYRSLPQLIRFHRERGAEFDAYFYQNGDPWLTLAPILKEEKRKIFTLLFNNPDYVLNLRNLRQKPELDAYINFETCQFGELIAFYLRNRPLLYSQPHLVTLLPTEFIINRNNRKGKME